jgi:hypothetical protein
MGGKKIEISALIGRIRRANMFCTMREISTARNMPKMASTTVVLARSSGSFRNQRNTKSVMNGNNLTL